MSLTVNAKTYTADSFQKDAVTYAGPLQTITIRDNIKISRVAPKPTSEISGVGRANTKLTRTLALTGALTTAHDAILDINVSVPVGYTAADVDAMLNDMGSFVASATYKDIVKKQLISY